MKMATERLDWLQFARKINEQVIRALCTISVTQCALTDLLCLIVQPRHLPFVHRPRRISSYSQAGGRLRRRNPFALVVCR